VLVGIKVGVSTTGTAVLASVGKAEANSGAEIENKPLQPVSHKVKAAHVHIQPRFATSRGNRKRRAEEFMEPFFTRGVWRRQ
jgi:hypothetical protein